MTEFQQNHYDMRAQTLIKNLRSRHFDAYYCADEKEALEKALELIPEGASVGWGGTVSAQKIGLLDAVRKGNYTVFDRDAAANLEERDEIFKKSMFADVYITGANALSLDGQMVNVDGTGNRVAAIVYGPKSVIVVAGMNKVADTLEAAMVRARTVAAPINKRRYPQPETPCILTGACGNCKSEGCICNQILITRNTRIPGRIKFILVGKELGF